MVSPRQRTAACAEPNTWPAAGTRVMSTPVVMRALPISAGLAQAGEILAVSFRHDGDGFRRGQHGAMTRARMVGVAVGHHRPVNGAHRVDVEVAGRAVEPLRPRLEQVFETDHPTDMGTKHR